MSNIKKFRIKSFKAKKSILELEKISLKFGRKIILENLSLKLNNGQILGLLGPNGVGKSTIFNLITGLLSPDYGSIFINSELVNKFPIYQRTLKFKIGFVPQHGGFFHDLTVYQNLKAIAEITIDNKSFRDEKISLIQNKKTVTLKLKIKEDQIVNVPYGNYICTAVLPTREDNKNFKNKAELDIMFSNDINKYPLMIRLKLKYGYLKLELDQVIN